jgi:DNA helicase-2/ATP-dependent DNA helicase PcrA
MQREDRLGRIAILYRTNAQSRQLEEALRVQRFVHVVGGFSLYQRAEVRDALAYLKVLLSPEDTVNLLRIINTPARGIGKSTLDQVERYANEHRIAVWIAIGRMLEAGMFPARAQSALALFRKLIEESIQAAAGQPLHAILKDVLERAGYWRMLKESTAPDAETRLENLQELLNAAAEAAERGEGIAEFLDHAALVSDSDQLDEGAAVSLLTLHNAKGLEFPAVFIAAWRRDSVHTAVPRVEAMLGGRRLSYVGMTRAERRLTLTWAARRRAGANRRTIAALALPAGNSPSAHPRPSFGASRGRPVRGAASGARVGSADRVYWKDI